MHPVVFLLFTRFQAALWLGVRQPENRVYALMLVFMFVMMRVFVRVVFACRIAAIQILAVLMVLRIQLQGNMGDAFALHKALHRLAHALRFANCHRAIQNQMGGK